MNKINNSNKGGIPERNKRFMFTRFFGGRKLILTSVTILSCLLMFQYKYYEILKVNSEEIDSKQSSKLFWTRLLFGRTRSKLAGKVLDIYVPPSWRSTVFNAIIKVLKINKNEIKYPLKSFRSISDLFSRYIREEYRPIDPIGTHSIVSPCDSVITDFGVIKSNYIHNVKGLKMNIKFFLGGDLKKKYTDGSTEFYYIIFYLDPKSYHHFHAPADFTCKTRRHISGEIFPVFPRMLKFLNNIFDINERVVLSGEWAGGNMYLTAVSAYNVGNIKIIGDKNLVTNQPLKQLSYLGGDIDTAYCKDVCKFKTGEEMGEFKLGSSIVLIFENKKDFQWGVTINQQINVGQRVGKTVNEQLKSLGINIKFRE